MESKKIYLIVCEGDSEFAYVQQLNRYLNEKGLGVVLIPANAHGGGFKSIRQFCREKKTQANGRTFVFVDRDIYFRDDDQNGTMYESEKHLLPPFQFQTWNFEDFLLLHFSPALIEQWRDVSASNGHANMPKRGKEFLPIFEAFCHDHNDELKFLLPYEKGDMPFSLTDQHFANLRFNNSGSYPHSEFAKIIDIFLAANGSNL